MEAKDKITILDGGMGRLLESMGAPFGRPEWSALALIEAPEYVESAHQKFIEAGAEIITVNAYALVPFHIGQERFDNDGRALIRLAADIARKTADNSSQDIRVAGSIPPVFGSYRPDLFIGNEAAAIYAPLLEEQESDIDFWLAETISNTAEAKIICQEIRKYSQKDIWLSYTIADREGGDILPQLRSGETIEEAVKTAHENGATAILFNCSQTEEMLPALKVLSSIIEKKELPLKFGAYGNAFPAKDKTARANEETTPIRADLNPKQYLAFAQKWKETGADIIGGCCGIGPEHIDALSALNKP